MTRAAPPPHPPERPNSLFHRRPARLMSQPSPAFAALHNRDGTRYAPVMNQPVKGQLKSQSIVSLDAAVDGSEALRPKVLEDLAVESSRPRNHPLRYVL